MKKVYLDVYEAGIIRDSFYYYPPTNEILIELSNGEKYKLIYSDIGGMLIDLITGKSVIIDEGALEEILYLCRV